MRLNSTFLKSQQFFQRKNLFSFPIRKWAEVAQSCLTFCDPMVYTVHGILQARILEWVAFPFSRDLRKPGIESRSLPWQVASLPAKPQGKPKNTGMSSLSLLQWIFLSQESNRVSCTAGRFFTNWAIKEALLLWKSRMKIVLPPIHMQWSITQQ